MNSALVNCTPWSVLDIFGGLFGGSGGEAGAARDHRPPRASHCVVSDSANLRPRRLRSFPRPEPISGNRTASMTHQ
jgi:hypothetical protein